MAVKKYLQSAKNRFSAGKKWSTNQLKKRPFVSFLAVLGLLLVLIAVGSFIRTPEPETAETTPTPTTVQVFEPGATPRLTMSGTVEKSGIFVVTAQTGGIVQKINVTEGSSISRGDKLVSLSTNYTGGSTATVQRQIASRNYQFSAETYETQKQIIAERREIAENTLDASEETRELTRRSIDETETQLEYNRDLLEYFDEQIEWLEELGATNDFDMLRTLKASRLQYTATIATLKTALRTSQAAADASGPDAQKAENTRDLTLKQLEIEERTLDLNKDIAALNVKLARISESLLYPASTCDGIVEQVFVNVGESVSPGTPIALIRANSRQAEINVSLPLSLATQVSRIEPTLMTVGDMEYELYPVVITLETATGTLGNIKYVLPPSADSEIGNNETIAVSVPLDVIGTSVETTIIPLDAVYQTANNTYVYVLQETEQGSVAAVREVQTGEVSGNYVTITSGLPADTRVIVTRGVTADEPIAIQ